MIDRMVMPDSAQQQQERMVEARGAAYRELAGENSEVRVPDDAHVQPVGEDGAWVTVQYWISAPRMRDYMRQPHTREGGM